MRHGNVTLLVTAQAVGGAEECGRCDNVTLAGLAWCAAARTRAWGNVTSHCHIVTLSERERDQKGLRAATGVTRCAARVTPESRPARRWPGWQKARTRSRGRLRTGGLARWPARTDGLARGAARFQRLTTRVRGGVAGKPRGEPETSSDFNELDVLPANHRAGRPGDRRRVGRPPRRDPPPGERATLRAPAAAPCGQPSQNRRDGREKFSRNLAGVREAGTP